MGMDDDLARRLAANVRQLREARALTQQQMAKSSGLPRATWANLESGTANPTLAVLDRVARAFQVSLEELTAPPRAAARLYPKGTLPTHARGPCTVRKLLPDKVSGMEIDRLTIPPQGRMAGVPHTPGTREYLTCEEGTLSIVVAGESWTLAPGDVLVFHGDQRHSYANPGTRTAVGYSVVVLARI
jgi:transcriptional regulator with XRE-family HTH domain